MNEQNRKRIIKMRNNYEILYSRLIDVWNDIQELDDKQSELLEEIELKGKYNPAYFEEFVEILTKSAPNYDEAMDRNFIP